MLWKRFNDQLALVLAILIVGLWTGMGLRWLILPGEIVGGTLTVFALIAQFYFRKAEPTPPKT